MRLVVASLLAAGCLTAPVVALQPLAGAPAIVPMGRSVESITPNVVTLAKAIAAKLR